MQERIFNLYLYITGVVINELGVLSYEMDGTDQTKLSFLQSHSLLDYQQAKHYPLPNRYRRYDVETGTETTGLAYDRYQQLSRMGRNLELFEEIFEELGAPSDPLICITPIVDGTPRVQATSRIG